MHPGAPTSAAAAAAAADPGRRRQLLGLLGSAVLLVLAVMAGVSVGAVPLPPGGVLATLAHRIGLPLGTPLGGTRAEVLLQLRLPRVVLAALVGGLLSVAGAGYQGVFRNPLADPYLLGAAAGAGLGATAAIVVGPAGVVPVAAFLGALGGVGLSYLLGSAAGRAAAAGGDPGAAAGTTLLLAGVAVASFLTAVQTVLQQAHTEDLHAVYAWILGQLGSAGWPQVTAIAPYAALSVGVLLVTARLLDLLAVGDDEVRTLGARPGRIRFVVLAAASLGTAAAVSAAGLIGFVGLVVPHLARLVVGGSQRVVVPVSLLAGAAFLVAADLVARTVIAPAELPIGVVTAFVGAPFFAAVLRLSGRRS